MEEEMYTSEVVLFMNQNYAYRRTITVAAPIPEGVTNMSSAFSYCDKLITAPIIPDGVSNITNVFDHCANLLKPTNIPSSVIFMGGAFSYCPNLKGDIYIHSRNIGACRGCFEGHNPENRVDLYIHKYTDTWDSFLEYLSPGRRNELNVHIKEF